ncbi:MAG: septation protein A [Pseudomonadota bacterium]
MSEETAAVAAVDKRAINPTLKLVLELGPVALFVLAYNFGDRLVGPLGLTGIWEKPIFLATGVIMVSTLVAIAISWALTRTLPAMPMVTAVVVSVFGGLTLYLQDDTFIKLKPTIVNTLFGVTLLAGMAFGRSFLKLVMDSAFKMTDEGWNKLTWRWGFFFLVLAVVNEVVWRNFSEEFWVGFKLWGMTGLTFLFVISQTPLMMRHAVEEKDEPQV